MGFSTAVRATIRVLGQRPADLLPIYILSGSIPAVAQVSVLVGILTATLYLEVTGRLEALRTELVAADLSPPDIENEAELEAWLEELIVILEATLTVTDLWVVGGVLGVAFIGWLTIAFVLYVVLTGGQLAACFARLRGERGVVAGLGGIRRYWLTFLLLYSLESLLWVLFGLLIMGAGGVVGLLIAAPTGEPLLALPIVLFGVLIWLLVGVAIRSLFAFSHVSVVVDDVGTIGSLSAAAGFLRRRPLQAGLYLLLAFGTLIATSTAASILALFEAASILSVLSILVVLPALGLLKTALYGEYRGQLSPPPAPSERYWTRFRRGFGRGVTELGAFVRQHPGLNLLSLGILLAGFGVGWLAAGPFVGIIDASIEARLEGLIPPTAALEFFGNNWFVALSMAFAGSFLAIPAISSLWFNGFFFGLIGRLEVDPVMLLAFVTPHGIFEIPAILVAGALGLFLGHSSWRTIRRRQPLEGLAEDLKRAFWIAIGLGIVLAIAAFIEGFVSPFYFRLFL